VEESRRDLRMFVAGVASAAHIIFGKPASITQIEACVSGIKNHFGGAFCAAEDLVDSGVLLVPPHDDDKPMVYHVDNPVEIKQEFSRNHRKECEELGQKIYKQEFGNSPKVTVSILPKILKDARAAIEQHERFPDVYTSERLVEMYDNIRWNEQLRRDSGDEVFRTYQQLRREIEEHS
jgi:hypothetical protein